jgi:hypothetical protein
MQEAPTVLQRFYADTSEVLLKGATRLEDDPGDDCHSFDGREFSASFLALQRPHRREEPGWIALASSTFAPHSGHAMRSSRTRSSIGSGLHLSR